MAVLIILAALAAIAAVHISTRATERAIRAYETDLADVRAVRRAASDLRAAGRGYVSSGDRLALVGARTLLAAATDRLHDQATARVARDARSLAVSIEALTRDQTTNLSTLDAELDRRTRDLYASSDAFIAAEHATLQRRIDSALRAARRSEVTSAVLALIAVAAAFGSAGMLLRALQDRESVHGDTHHKDDQHPQPQVLT